MLVNLFGKTVKIDSPTLISKSTYNFKKKNENAFNKLSEEQIDLIIPSVCLVSVLSDKGPHRSVQFYWINIF